MDNTKYTKGKWLMSGCPFYDEDQKEYHGSFDIITEGMESIITGVHAYSFYNQTFETAKANALLISKAPEMLEMLKECMRVLSSVQSPATASILLHREIDKLIKEATDI